MAQPWTLASLGKEPVDRPLRPGDQNHPQGLRTVTRGHGFWGARLRVSCCSNL